MVYDRASSFGSGPEPARAANKVAAAPLTQEQQEFARVLGRLLAERWARRKESEPPPPSATSGDASGHRSG
jgi:hypothetical protein